MLKKHNTALHIFSAFTLLIERLAGYCAHTFAKRFLLSTGKILWGLSTGKILWGWLH